MPGLSCRSYAVLVLCLLIGGTVAGADSDLQALRGILAGSTCVVRGYPVSSRVGRTVATASYQYVEFHVSEVMKGVVAGSAIDIRQDAREPAPEVDAEDDGAVHDVIVALGPRHPEDGSYEALPGFSEGTYRVISRPEGEFVLVNALGVDADSVTPKDVHLKSPNSEVPIERFREIARSSGTAAVQAAAPTPQIPKSAVPAPAEQSIHAPAAATPAAAGRKDFPLRAWMAIAATGAAIAIVVAWRRRKFSTSRRK